MTTLDIFVLYLKISFVSFGGIFSTWSLMQTMMKDCEHVPGGCLLSQSAFAFSLSLSNILPGPKISGLSIVSYPIAGIPGMLATAAALSLPGLIIIPIIRFVRTRWRESAHVDAFVDGARFATVAILIVFWFDLLRDGWKAHPGAMFFVVAFVGFWLNVRYRLNALLIIALSGLSGYLFLG